MEGKLFFGQYLIWLILLLGQLHGYKSCTENEKMALLELKEYLKFISEYGEAGSVHPTWTNDTKRDCCTWEGVKCNLTTGRISGISIGSIFPKENALLNLSLLHPFEDVQSLNFSVSKYTIGGFSGLFDNVEGHKSLRRLRNLEILDLSTNAFNNSIFPFLNVATSLKTLFLRFNNMDGPFPVKGLKDLTNLELLDLSGCGFNGSIPVRDLSIMTKLKALDLSHNDFSGSSMELQEICKLKNMQELDLSRNKLVGEFPLCLTSLRALRVLDLSSNNLTGKLPSSLGNLESLEYFSVSDNDFEGFFSLGSLTNLSELRVFILDSKSNSFQVDSESFWKPKFQLNKISLQSCNLEKILRFLLQQKDLHYVDLSYNKFFGNFPSWLLANNTNLKVLRLRNNNFTSFQLPKSAHSLVFLDVSFNEIASLIPENIGWILPHLRYMNISNNGFQGNMPSSLSNMKSIEYLDATHNSFHGKLPRSFLEGCYSLAILKLSYNKLSGEALPESTNFTSIYVLYIDNNQFTGKIGQGLQSLRSLSLLDMSNNNLTGVIPSWIGELPSLTALLISNNLLEGEIPATLFNGSRLQLLDLSSNILSGDIPLDANSTVPELLFLQNNNLSGVIPEALLGNVEVLDLRNNRLSGKIPEFINTQNTFILLLRGNHLTGSIPIQLCALRYIRLLDLSNNRLNGSIPSCLSNTSFDSQDMDMFISSYDLNSFFTTLSLVPEEELVGTYSNSMLVIDQVGISYSEATQTKVEFGTKHRYDTYMGGNLVYLFGMDLSRNELSGEIPVELGGLLKLQAFNISHNYLSGVIPESFSGMKNMESLDFSFNRLQGRIPSQLTELSSLAVFNVSYNNLSGVIPQGRQFNTFDTPSYLGNHLLCGKPTNRSCNSDAFQEPDNGVEADESTVDMVSFYWSLAAAYVTILVGILASLSFDSCWRRVWFYIVDAFIRKARNLLCQVDDCEVLNDIVLSYLDNSKYSSSDRVFY